MQDRISDGKIQIVKILYLSRHIRRIYHAAARPRDPCCDKNSERTGRNGTLVLSVGSARMVGEAAFIQL
jgi:hypothetical protein